MCLVSSAQPVALSAQASAPSAPTHAEVEAFAKRIEDACNRGDLSALAAVLDTRAMFERALRGLVPADASEPARIGASHERGILLGWTDGTPRPAGCRHLRVRRDDDGVDWLVFRSVTDVLPHYFELAVGRDLKGALRVADSGGLSSPVTEAEKMRRTLLIEGGHGFVGHAEEAEHLKYVDDALTRLSELSTAGPEAVLREFHLLRDSSKADPLLLWFRVGVAARAGREEYEKAFADFHARCPNQIALDMLDFSMRMRFEQYNRALAAIQRIEARVGRDPYLDAFRGEVLFMTGELQQAKEAFRRSAEFEPHLPHAHRKLLLVALAGRDYPEAARLVRLLEREFGGLSKELMSTKMFDGFTRSAEYRELQRERAGPPATTRPGGWKF